MIGYVAVVAGAIVWTLRDRGCDRVVTTFAPTEPAPVTFGAPASGITPAGTHGLSITPQANGGRNFVRFWVLPLVTIAVLFLVIATILLWNVFVDDPPSDSSGGALLMFETDTEPEVAIDASLRGLGYGGDWLRLQVEALDGVPAGTRWYLYVSGQYRPPADAALEGFCSNATIAVRDGATIRCPNDPGLFATSDVEYRRDEELGFPAVDHIEGVVGHAYYDADDVTTITGVFAPEDEFDQMWVINVPIADIELGKSGSERQGHLAAIGVNDFEWGASGEAIDAPPMSPNASSAVAVSTSTGHSLEAASVESFSLEADYLLHTDRLIWSNPEVDATDTLYWTARAASYEFASLQAGVQGRSAGLAFLGGVMASVGIGALLLLVEKSLERADTRWQRAASISEAQ